MTSTQLHPSPPLACPDWCQHPELCSWDQLNETGQLMRGHGIGSAPAVPADGGYRSVEVRGYAEEYVDGTPITFGVSINAPNMDLTPDQAREVARHLTETAQQVQDIQGRIERVSGGQL